MTPLIDPATARVLREAMATVAENVRGQMRIWSGQIEAQKRAAEERRRDRDEELDWVGEWGGRRG